MVEYLIAFILLVGIVVFFLKVGIRRITIFEYEKGLKYLKGKFKEIKEPGQYWYIPFFSSIQKVDIRPCFVSITGQEVLSSDGVTLKVSLAAKYEIVKPGVAINEIQSYHDALYLELQLALREIIGNATIDNLLEKRNEFSNKVVELTKEKIKEFGINLISANIKDIMFPGQLKQIFAQVVKAKKEGQAALEKARGETAALRNLANAAKMIDSNPNLMHLRLVQSLGESSGNTLVLGMPSQTTTIPIKTKEIEDSATKQTEKD